MKKESKKIITRNNTLILKNTYKHRFQQKTMIY